MKKVICPRCNQLTDTDVPGSPGLKVKIKCRHCNYEGEGTWDGQRVVW